MATLLLCEVILGAALPGSRYARGWFMWPPHFRVVFKPSEATMPGVSGAGEFIVNSNGLRGDELGPDYTYRILAIGGSTTEGLYLDQRETWTKLLQEFLNQRVPHHRVWVGNGGKSGRTTPHHAVALSHLPLEELGVDAVLLLIGGNDLSHHLAWSGTRDLNHAPTEEALLPEVFLATPDEPLYKRTALWRLLRGTKQRLLESTQDEVGQAYTSWRTHRQKASEIRRELPDLRLALDTYAGNVHALIDIAARRSVRPIFMTQPSLWRPDLPERLEALLWMGGIGDFMRYAGKAYYSAEALQNGMAAYNETLLRVCEERRIECVDLASLLDKDTTVFYDDMHFNEAGARKVAELLAQYLVARPPLAEQGDRGE
jgi:lysophospholipase L1-like esterase